MENDHYAFVLITDQKYWNRLRQPTHPDKQIRFFIRKSQVAPTQTKKLLFYVKKPHMQIRGTADFTERLVGDTQELWNKYGAESFFESLDEYNAFAQGNKKMTFIHFENFEELADPKPKETVAGALGSLVWFRPRYVNRETAELLTGKV